MNLKDRLKDRYTLLMIIMILLFSVLIVRLATLTIAEGEHYREIADTKRLQDIPITAARGEIRDRNGKLLAGNKSSFTVQLLKEGLEKDKEKEEINDNILKLTRLLEEDGVGYLDEFPIELNVYKYKDDDDYLQEERTPEEKLLDIIIENGKLAEMLSMQYIHPDYPDHYRYVVAERPIQTLKSKGTDVPVYVESNENGVEFKFDGKVDALVWKSENDFPSNASPLQVVTRLVANNKTALREVIEHPIARKMIYERLESIGYQSNIIMEEYVLTFDEEYKEQKRKLMDSYEFVTEDTSAKEDFLNIFKEVSLENFLETTNETTNIFGREKLSATGEKLVRMVQEKDRDVRIKIEIDEEKELATYKYEGEEDVGDKTGKEYLIEKAMENNVLNKFLTDDEIRPLAQSQLLKDGVNTRISVAKEYEYVSLNEKKKLYESNDIDEKSDVKDAFDKLIKKHKIDKNISKYEARSILVINDILNNHGHRAYEPINIAYGIKDLTVAKIEEGMSDIGGVNISIEPIRYYPEGVTASHTLGYLGRISQENEIKKYVDEKGYSPNDIIGKTGIEESFEDRLRGKNGIKTVEVDVFGNTTRELKEVKPTPGDNVYLSIDMDLQKKAEETLKETLDKTRVGGTYQSEWGNFTFRRSTSKGRPYKNATSGATVAVDVNTGEVLAMASYPGYDPNLFSTGISNSDWETLFPENKKDQLAPRPLLNIATQTAVQPGSTFKMATALAGLEKGMSPNTTIYDKGVVKIGDLPFRCWIWKNGRGSHGSVNVYKAIEKSCNYYFYSLALGSAGPKVEIEDLRDMTVQLGLDDKTGIEINIPAEAENGAPSPEKKISTVKNMFRMFLNNNLAEFSEKELSEDDMGKIIEDIVAWSDEEVTPSKVEVLNRLKEMGINGEKSLNDGTGEDLADRIAFQYLQDGKWTIGDTLNATIGQGQGQYTPIQMANFVATIANGGNNNKLTLIDNVKNYNNSKVTFEPKKESKPMNLKNPENLNHVKEGMRRVSEQGGTGSAIFRGFPVATGTKTGTAQKDGTIPGTNEKYDDFAWFVGFAPFDDPEIAVATVLFQGGTGGNAGPMTREIMAEHLGLNEEHKEEEVDQLPFENILVR